LMAFGIVCGILEARQSGHGQVVDAAMVDGAALQMAMIYGLYAAGKWKNQRGTNFLDGGAHFYNTYECADGKYVAIGPIEPQFYALLLEKLEIANPEFRAQMDESLWPRLKDKLAAVFITRNRDEWCELLQDTNVCFAPVLDLEEASRHAHHAARGTFVRIDGVVQPAPAPRFSRTKPEAAR
jgi:alpha-methylacyl-CoA racemase